MSGAIDGSGTLEHRPFSASSADIFQLLSEKGFTVDAVDISTMATSRLTGRHSNINIICTDLDTCTIPPDRYDLIVNIKYLDRRLFPMIRNW